MDKNKIYEDKDRKNALKRAQKFQVLFKEKTFDAIMNAVESSPQNKKAFDEAVLGAGAKLKQEEADWLWGYLQHSNEALWKPVPEAEPAYTGW